MAIPVISEAWDIFKFWIENIPTPFKIAVVLIISSFIIGSLMPIMASYNTDCNNGTAYDLSSRYGTCRVWADSWKATQGCKMINNTLSNFEPNSTFGLIVSPTVNSFGVWWHGINTFLFDDCGNISVYKICTSYNNCQNVETTLDQLSATQLYNTYCDPLEKEGDIFYKACSSKDPNQPVYTLKGNEVFDTRYFIALCLLMYLAYFAIIYYK